MVREKPVRKDWNADLQEGFKEAAEEWLFPESGLEHVPLPNFDFSPSPRRTLFFPTCDLLRCTDESVLAFISPLYAVSGTMLTAFCTH